MKVELFLSSINQEMIDAGRPGPGEIDPPDEWTVSWPKSCCVIDFSIAPHLEDISRPPTEGFVLRSEKDGGMFWDPRSGSVYTVDEEAYHALLEFDGGASELEVARRVGCALDDVRELTETLRSIGRREAS